ncbi:MAG: hypothetical protein EHM42_11360, partial [Planctomycetaceae bacterium]
MIIPQYWAEGRICHRESGRQVTVRRFGWSDVSQADAQANAELRTAEALKRVLAGESLRRRELKVPYNGADGVPIREEILSRHGSSVVTRNSYGAWCLNTPDVLFADIDYEIESSCLEVVLYGVGLAVLAGIAGWYLGFRLLAFVFANLGFVLGGQIPGLLKVLARRVRGGAENQAVARARSFLARHPEWNLRLYRTPAGLRVLVTHATFCPKSQIVSQFFRALRVDPKYARMCQKQNCFRARLTAKPWRISIATHMRPRPGVWPVASERLAQRTAWIEKYESAAQSYAACQLIAESGSGATHPEVADVRDLHDALCR